MIGKRLVVAAALLAVAQIGFLSWMIAGRAAILRHGQEVLLKVEPVDPRDLLRGDYVQLGYEITRIPVALITNLPANETAAKDGPIVVRLRKAADGYWRPVAATLGSQPGPAEPGDVDILGHVEAGWNLFDEGFIGVEYGIERFYLPEGEGKAIENDMRRRSFGVRVALAKDGGAQIKALVDGQTVLFEEPLY